MTVGIIVTPRVGAVIGAADLLPFEIYDQSQKKHGVYWLAR